MAFTVAPSSQTTTPSTNTGNYTVHWGPTISDPTAISFTLSDGGHGGTFTPASPVNTSNGQGQFTFVYKNATAGTYTLTVHCASGPQAGQPDQTATAIVSAATSFSDALVGTATLADTLTRLAPLTDVLSGSATLADTLALFLPMGDLLSGSATLFDHLDTNVPDTLGQGTLVGSGLLTTSLSLLLPLFENLVGTSDFVVPPTTPYLVNFSAEGDLFTSLTLHSVTSGGDYTVTGPPTLAVGSPGTFTITRTTTGSPITITFDPGNGDPPITVTVGGAPGDTITFTYDPTKTGPTNPVYTNTGGATNPVADPIPVGPSPTTVTAFCPDYNSPGWTGTTYTLSATGLPITLPYLSQRSGFSAVGFQVAWGSLSPDNTITDISGSTGIDFTASVPLTPASVTAGVDLGSSLLVNSISYAVGVTSASTLLVVETSTNGATWTSLPCTAPTQRGNFFVTSDIIQSGLPVTARYIRISVSDNSTSPTVMSRAAVTNIVIGVAPTTVSFSCPNFPGAQYIFSYSFNASMTPSLSSDGLTPSVLTIKPFLEEPPLVNNNVNHFGRFEIEDTSGSYVGPDVASFPMMPIADNPGGTATFWIANEGTAPTGQDITLNSLSFRIVTYDCTRKSWSASAFDGVVTFAWVSTSGNNNVVKTAQHRSMRANAGSPTTGWEAAEVVEAGLNSDVFVYHTQIGTTMLSYTHNAAWFTKINKSRGAAGHWKTRNPSLFRYEQDASPYQIGLSVQPAGGPALVFGSARQSGGSDDTVSYVFPGLQKAKTLDGEIWG